MAELVDAHVSGACIERCAGSSPVPGTKKKTDKRSFFFVPSTVLDISPVVGKADAFGTGHQKEDRQAVFFLYLELDTALLSTVKHGRVWIGREVGGKHISNCSTVAV